MTDDLKIQINDRRVRAWIDAAVQTVGNTHDVLDTIGNVVANEVRQSFIRGESPYHEPWAPLKLRAGQPLRDTGRLMNSITYQVWAGYVEVGTNVCYAPVHQFGATIKARPGQPGRNRCGRRKGVPFLVFQGADRKPIFARQVTIPARPFLPDTRGFPATMRRKVITALSDMMGGGGA